MSTIKSITEKYNYYTENQYHCQYILMVTNGIFLSIFLEKLGLSDDDLPQFEDPDTMKQKLASIFATKTQVRI